MKILFLSGSCCKNCHHHFDNSVNYVLWVVARALLCGLLMFAVESLGQI